MQTTPNPHPLVENFFRDQWRNAIAALTAQFGLQHIEDVENAVQAAMVKALDRWTVGGIPDNPGGWIFKVARNTLLDELRKRQTQAQHEGHVADAIHAPADGREMPDTDPLSDDVLKMIVVCSHPVIKTRDSVILTLRIVCALGYGEIASGLCMGEEAVRKSLTRCKSVLSKHHEFLELPGRTSRAERLGRVLRTIYLLFNEGYFASHGDAIIRPELCGEAERLLALLRSSSVAADNRIWALSALVALQSSRLPARVGGRGEIKLLEAQDRHAWDRPKIAEGLAYFQRSLSSYEPSRYHYEAAIAAIHASAPSYEETDWRRIVDYYDMLYDMTASPVVRMNRAVAVMELKGPDAALKELLPLEQNKEMKHNRLLFSVLAECYRRCGDTDRARSYYQAAIDVSANSALNAFWADRGVP